MNEAKGVGNDRKQLEASGSPVAEGGMASIILEPGFVIEQIVAGSGFHTVNGVAFGPDGRLFAASVAGESIFALDLATGAIESIVAAPGHG